VIYSLFTSYSPLVIASCGLIFAISSCGSSVEDSEGEDSATEANEFIPTSIYLAVAESGWDGTSLSSFLRDPDNPSAVEPYIDFQFLDIEYLQQVTSDNSCSWVSKFSLGDGVALSDPDASIDPDDEWLWVHLPLELGELETNCAFLGLVDLVDSVKFLDLTLSLGPLKQGIEVEVVQMLHTLGYDDSDVAGRMFGVRVGLVSSVGDEIWFDIGWGVSRLVENGVLSLDQDGAVQLNQVDGFVPAGALSMYGMFSVELAELLR
jgi:hypothetical protein